MEVKQDHHDDRSFTVRLSERLMGLLPSASDPDISFFSVARLDYDRTPPAVFDHLLAAAQDKYDSEFELSFLDLYFAEDVADLLRGKVAVDLGCSVGGRGIAWNERLKFSASYGVDILVQDLKVAKDFAAAAGTNNEYVCSRAEALPFPDSSVEIVLSYDTFEHVENIAQVLAECRRIIAPGGHLIAVFPPFYNPLESHLLVSNTPFLHWFVSGEVLTRAQHNVSVRRGWPVDLLPRSLAPWEKLPTLNGIQIGSFDALVSRGGWEIAYRRLCPLFTTGRRAHKLWIFRLLRRLCSPMVFLPYLREYFTDRAVYVLRKPVESDVV